MEPAVTVALISTAAKLFGTFIEMWDASQKVDNKQKKVNKWISENYYSLRAFLSENCVKLLAAVEGGKRFRGGDFLKVLYPKHKLDRRSLVLLKNELHYRLEFLVLIGVLRHLPSIQRYEITRLGVAFLELARAKKDYGPVLLKQ
jgi:hypothetical protein